MTTAPEQQGAQALPESCLYAGQVMHKRLRPFGHRFAYRVYSLFLDIDAIDDLAKEQRIFSHNRFNLLSFHDRDHGARDGSCLRGWAEEKLVSAGVHGATEKIYLLCFPRVLGYVFNPLSIWYCHGSGGKLRAVIYEVSNTFGETRSYILPVPADWQPDRPLVHSCAKDFYVSPFIAMDSRYRFRLMAPGARLSILIRQWVEGEELLIASQTGKRQAFSGANLMAAFLRYPLVAQKVMVAIHWQALKLWLKGAKLQARPAAVRRRKKFSKDNSVRWLWNPRV